jgi:hypothetical protein
MSFDSRRSLKDKKIIIVDDGDCEMNGLTVRMQKKEQEEMKMCVCECASEGLSFFHTARQCQRF